MRTLRAAALLVFYIVLLIVGAPFVLFCMAFRISAPLFVVADWAMRVSRAVLGIKVEASGLERLDPAKPYVFMANHTSLLDGPMLFVLIPQRVRVILKKSVFAFPVLGWIMTTAGFVPVDRKAGGAGVRSIERAVRAMREKGHSFLIFPEGTRSLDGKLGRFHRGGFFLAIGAGAPIVPVTIRGTFALMPKRRFGAKRGTVRVEFHDPVPVEGCSVDNMDGLVEKVRDAIGGQALTFNNKTEC
jgi:1-acyl-sn-glycerol-3-phosphate acyltransferase